MRKTVMFSAVALALGFIAGVVCSSSFILPASSPVRTAISASAVSLVPAASGAQRTPEDEGLDTDGNAALLHQAGEVLEAIRDKDYARLSSLAHPEYGVRFTPYSTVRPESDLCLTPAQIAVLDSDSTRYLWGTDANKAEPIRMTVREYFDRYVFNADYTKAPLIGVDTVVEAGNALENVDVSFPDCRFVDYHFQGIEPKNKGFDWCSLKVVLAPYQGGWRLVALIHSEWTT